MLAIEIALDCPLHETTTRCALIVLPDELNYFVILLRIALLLSLPCIPLILWRFASILRCIVLSYESEEELEIQSVDRSVEKEQLRIDEQRLLIEQEYLRIDVERSKAEAEEMASAKTHADEKRRAEFVDAVLNNESVLNSNGATGFPYTELMSTKFCRAEAFIVTGLEVFSVYGSSFLVGERADTWVASVASYVFKALERDGIDVDPLHIESQTRAIVACLYSCGMISASTLEVGYSEVRPYKLTPAGMLFLNKARLSCDGDLRHKGNPTPWLLLDVEQ